MNAAMECRPANAIAPIPIAEGIDGLEVVRCRRRAKLTPGLILVSSGLSASLHRG
jgi:hypothetical protein